ncbi:type II toxin-antitoxin system VapC family toxin [Candidatus Gottesmanbacteria bacterium]|nr:type II toxin-antitoxin system VapC family toxin [Candidatus Gottesmanbacteria bacterium]
MIIDASVGIKLIKKNEEYRQQSLIVLRNHFSGRQKIIIPSLFYIEVSNYLVTNSHSTLLTIKKHLEFFYESRLICYESSREDIFETLNLAKKYNTTVYDMLYAVVAKKHKTFLITADDKFIQKTKFSFVKHISAV